MKKTILREQLDRMSNILSIPIVNELVLDEYYDALKSFSDVEIERGITELLQNISSINKYIKMPLIYDIKKSIKNSKPSNFYKQEKFERDDDYSKDLLSLAEKYRPSKDKEKLKTRKELYTEKFAAGLIFSHKLMKWVDKTLDKNIGGTFIYPEEELKKIVTKSKIEFETEIIN